MKIKFAKPQLNQGYVHAWIHPIYAWFYSFDAWIYPSPQAFKAAKTKNPDILSYNKAMNDYNNLKDWLAATLKVMRQLKRKKAWIECLKSEAKGQQIAPCAWVFRYKQNPAGEIIKCKA